MHGVELDTCADHGTWFDARELETLVKILRHETTPLANDASSSTISCQGCHQKISANRANVTDRGLLCDSCWREETRALIEAADATNARNGQVVSGAMLGFAAVMLGAAFSSHDS